MGKYALLIGNSRFADGRLNPLLAPQNDVENLRSVLEDAAIGGFQVFVARDHDLEAVQTDICQVTDNKGADDLVLVYYSGHGLIDRSGSLFLALVNSDVSSPSARSLAAEFIQRQFKNSAAGQQILVLDCCHSGAAVAGGKSAAVQRALTNSPLDPERQNFFVLASSESTQLSTEAAGQSQFTKFLVEGLSNGTDAADKEDITIEDLAAYVATSVKNAGLPMRPQFPSREKAGPAATIVVARNPKFAPIDAAVIAALNDDKDNYRRLGAIADLWAKAKDRKFANSVKRIVEILQARLQAEQVVQVHKEIADALAAIGGDAPVTRPLSAMAVPEQSVAEKRSLGGKLVRIAVWCFAIIGVIMAVLLGIGAVIQWRESQDDSVDPVKIEPGILLDGSTSLIVTDEPVSLLGATAGYELVGTACGDDPFATEKTHFLTFDLPLEQGTWIGAVDTDADIFGCSDIYVQEASTHTELASGTFDDEMTWDDESDDYCVYLRGDPASLYAC